MTCIILPNFIIIYSTESNTGNGIVRLDQYDYRENSVSLHYV